LKLGKFRERTEAGWGREPGRKMEGGHSGVRKREELKAPGKLVYEIVMLKHTSN